MKKFACGIYEKTVADNHSAVCCDICNKQVHVSCNNFTLQDISIKNYKKMKRLGTVRSA